ncbi:MAG TPA: hypothetical protein VFR07_07965 [Mycobacteriales bacterium]|jgi:hypothetical protein|nr:hypothetical protein [Mycobacteriales bacterium]
MAEPTPGSRPKRPRWGVDKDGIPEVWFAPFGGILAFVAVFLVNALVFKNVFQGLASGLTFAVVWTGLAVFHRRRLLARQRP